MTNNFQHKKSLGQHFLNSDYVPKQMCDAAGDIAGKTVLEIGPGTGILTREILTRGARVVAVEADQRAISSLEETFPDEIARGQLTIHHHDARTLDPSQFGLEKHSYIVISNIPYYLSGSLFRSLLDTNCQPSDLVFLVQKEVAERIARDPKESLLSLSVKVFGDPSYICTVKRGHFTPPPKVDSAIVAVHNISHDKIPAESYTAFFSILHLGFAQKRKQLLGNLSAEYDRGLLETIFTELQISHTVRGEDLPLAVWLSLLSKLHPQLHPTSTNN
ncbi:MAG: ribosomal RNA small subunit methyltransferase A [Candidatus Kaiserbacteria bacterium]|nr:ribosomal RNA small subunit methyltransferase A [Candidatus Kaiserbacteria bacterium]MCB9816515.1 ribosomal RNA small subunit methyltransferase A [Candidatus Nomurabacteria bacterium]